MLYALTCRAYPLPLLALPALATGPFLISCMLTTQQIDTARIPLSWRCTATASLRTAYSLNGMCGSLAHTAVQVTQLLSACE